MHIDGGWLVLGQDGEVLGAPGAGSTGGGAAGGPAPAGGGGIEGADGGAPGAAPGGAPGAGGFDLLFPLLIGLMIFMIISTMLSGRKEKKRRAEMLSSIGKHDKVQTIGGVIGTVEEVKDTEIVVMVDRSTKTRLTFAKSAVQTVLQQGKSGTESSVAEPELEKVGV